MLQAVLAAVRVQEGGLLQRHLPEARLEKAQDELPSNGGSGNLHLYWVFGIIGYFFLMHFQASFISLQVIGQEKGRGLVATRGLNPGKVVLAEQPVLCIQPTANTVADMEEVVRKYGRLPGEVKKQVHMLNAKNQEVDVTKGRKRSLSHTQVLNIWHSNNVSIEDVYEEETGLRGLYPEFAIINHSCAPNCIVNFDDERNLKVVALMKIEKGEEIVINYLDSLKVMRDSLNRTRGQILLRFERQKMLKKEWNFICKCIVCSLSGQELERNESLKKNLIWVVEKQDEYNNNQPTMDNVKHYAMTRLTWEIEIFDLMKKLGVESIKHIPDSLQLCYLYSKMLQIIGVPLAESPDSFWRAAHQQARMLGDSFLRRFNNQEVLFDDSLAALLSEVVEQKKEEVGRRFIIISREPRKC